MKSERTNNRPSHAVYMVEGDRENAFWTKIGSAWLHEDGEGLNLVLSAMPMTGRLVIRKWEAKEQQRGQGK